MQDEIVVTDNSNTEEGNEEIFLDENEGNEESQESVEEIRAKLSKAEELSKNYKIRAEKAEKAERASKESTKKESSSENISQKDLFALINNKVNEDDISEVADFAKLKGISISDALKTSTVKAILNEKEEQRNTANATNTGPVRRNSSKATDEALIDKAKKGDMPDSDADIDRLIKARKGIK